MTTERKALFLDLDGVLVDFDGGVRRVIGVSPGDIKPAHMWPRLARSDDFFEMLEWTRDGNELWQAVRAWKPTILTGLPVGRWAEPQKRRWCSRELGADVTVVCCLARDKPQAAAEALRNGLVPVLVDDRETNREDWERAGGTFVLHVDARTSIEKLSELGIR